MAVSQGFCVFQRLHRVQRFAGLGNGNDQLVRIGNHAAVSVFAGDFDIGRDFGDGFQPIFGGQRGVIGRAAGKDFDAADAFKHAFGVFAEVFGDEAAVEENLRRVCNRARLLMDFLCIKWLYGPSSKEASESSDTLTLRSAGRPFLSVSL